MLTCILDKLLWLTSMLVVEGRGAFGASPPNSIATEPENRLAFRPAATTDMDSRTALRWNPTGNGRPRPGAHRFMFRPIHQSKSHSDLQRARFQ